LEGDAQVWYQVATSVEEALEIDRVMGMDHWRKALNKEMLTVMIAWNFKTTKAFLKALHYIFHQE
jgi:hypothetical protein